MCILCDLLGRSAAQSAAAHVVGGDAVIGGGDAPFYAMADPVSTNPMVGATISDKPVWSTSQIVSNLTRWGVKWAGASPTVTYQFYDSAPAGFPAGKTFMPLTADERALARQAFTAWADVANIKFVEATDNGVYGRASGRVSLFLDAAAPSYEWGSTTSGGNAFSSISYAAISISPAAVNARKLFIGGYNFQALMHEIGHAIGLPHPGDYNADGSTITYAKDATYYQDSRQYTIMSYFDASNTGANFTPPGETASYSSATPLIDDIAAIQAIYGANPTTRGGDTVYGYNSTAGLVAFDFTVTTAPIISIYDSGGNDTIDLSGSAYGAVLNLNAGVFSDVQGLVGNLSIAYGTVIENAVGTAAADTLTGNGVANSLKGGGGDDVLQGGGGNDVLDGGDGNDTAAYAGASSDYDWWFNRATNSWTVDDARAAPVDGTDSLISVEQLRFSDKTVALQAPTTEAAFLTLAYQNVLRAAPAGGEPGFVAGLTASVGSGAITEAQALAQIAARASATTAVAVLSYEFFTGSTPTKAGLDYLVSPTGVNANNLNSPYYQSFSLENRYINFAVNLGKLGEGSAGFSVTYGALSLSDTVKTAYTTIFGGAPTDAKVADILSAPTALPGVATRADYFAYYGQDGAAGLGTKAAAVGYLLAEAVKADLGTYAKADDAFLVALGGGAHTHVDLVGVYGQTSYAYAGG